LQQEIEDSLQAVASLTLEEFQQFNRLLDTERRDRLAQLAAKARRHAANARPEQAEQILQEAVAGLHVWSLNAAFDCLVDIIILRNGGADGWYAPAQLGLVMMLGP
jgi:hypothetical protein